MEAAIIVLGRAFLAYPPTSRCARLCSNQLILHDYYQQVGRVVYRIVVLLVAKARDVLLDLTAAPAAPPPASATPNTAPRPAYVGGRSDAPSPRMPTSTGRCDW